MCGEGVFNELKMHGHRYAWASAEGDLDCAH